MHAASNGIVIYRLAPVAIEVHLFFARPPAQRKHPMPGVLGTVVSPFSGQNGALLHLKADHRSALQLLAPRKGSVLHRRAATQHRGNLGRQAQVSWVVRSTTAGDGGTGGGSGGSSAGDGEGENDDSGPAGLAANVWVLVLAAATALGLFKVGSQKLRQREQSRRLDSPDWQRLDLEQGIEWLKERKEWLQSQAWLRGSSDAGLEANHVQSSLPATSTSKAGR